MEKDSPDESKWKFKTLDGVEWTFRLSYLLIKRVREETGISLPDILIDPKAAADAMATDLGYLTLMFSALKPDADRLGKTLEDFLSSVNGDVLIAANAALQEALTDFFPESRRRIVRRALERARAVNERLTNAATLAAEKTMEAMTDEEITTQTLMSSASSSPASAA